MKSLIFVSLLGLFSFTAFAEEKKCEVKGMHCEACADMVKDRVCEGKDYEVCDVQAPMAGKDKKKANFGKLHIKTKDAATKIDVKGINTAMADTQYSVVCK